MHNNMFHITPPFPLCYVVSLLLVTVLLTQTNTANVQQVLFLTLCQFSSTIPFAAQNAPLPMQRQSRETWLKHITQLNDITTSLHKDYV